MKDFTMKDLKSAAASVAAAYGLDIVTASKLIGFYNTGSAAGVKYGDADSEKIAAILAGDLSSVPAAAAAIGVCLGVNTPEKDRQPVQGVKNLPGSVKKIPEKKRTAKPKTEKTEGKANNKGKEASAGGGVETITGESALSVETITGEIIAPGVAAPGLPENFCDTVESWLSDYAARYEIDLYKCPGLQWRGACLYIGKQIQKSDILRDREREKREGGKIYNPERVESLLYLWEYITSSYKHIPLASDFIAFAGVSRDWFYDSSGKGLTSSRADIAKKARQIEESGLSAGLVDGRENPTGRIYYSKARLGWKETTEIVHVSAAAASAAPSLPVFDGSSGFLPDKETEKAPESK